MPNPAATQPAASRPASDVLNTLAFTNNGARPVKVLEVLADDPKIKLAVKPEIEGKKYQVEVRTPAGYQSTAAARTVML